MEHTNRSPSVQSGSAFVGEYARDFETWAEFYDSEPELAVLEEHGDFADSDVLDAGCGSGRLSFRLGGHAGSWVGVDIVPSLVELCHRRLIDDYDGDRAALRFEVQDLENLPYPDGHFDTILDAWTFSTLEDFASGASEYERVLRDGGTVLAIESGESSPYQDIVDRFVPPDHYDEELPPMDELMRSAFGEPRVTERIESSYEFRSVGEAAEAFAFHLSEWTGVDLSEADRARLLDSLEAYEDGGRVRIGERATFYKFTFE